MAYKNPEPKLDEIVEGILEEKSLEEKGNDYNCSCAHALGLCLWWADGV